MYLNKIYFVRDYDFIYMIMENLTMNWFWYPNQWGYLLVLWYPANGGYSLVFWYPDQWGLFIGILIPRQWDYSLVLWYPNQWGLFIGILILKPMGVVHWYSDTQPIGVIYWYSDAQSQGYNMTIVIRLLRIWITFEYLTILSP